MDTENRLVVAKEAGVGEGQRGRPELGDANYCTWNGKATTSLL